MMGVPAGETKACGDKASGRVACAGVVSRTQAKLEHSRFYSNYSSLAEE